MRDAAASWGLNCVTSAWLSAGRRRPTLFNAIPAHGGEERDFTML